MEKNFLDVLWYFFVSIGPGESGNGRLKVRRGCEHPEPGLLLKVGVGSKKSLICNASNNERFVCRVFCSYFSAYIIYKHYKVSLA